MKFAALLEYRQDPTKLQSLHPARRVYLRRFLENGQLRAAGPFAEGAGALWILDAESPQSAEEIIRAIRMPRRGC